VDKQQPCRCCRGDKKPNNKIGVNGYGYNRLQNKDKEWAAEHGIAQSEFCVPVKGGKKFGGPTWLKQKCGDGRLGFSVRRRNRTEVQMVFGLDGQLIKKRGTLVRRKSSRATSSRRPKRIDGSKFSLISSSAIRMAARDPDAIAQRKGEYRKLKRARNRNNNARRGHKRVMRAMT
jgi:hypothetical protein